MSVGIWCADKEVGSLVANTTVGPHAAGNSILCCIPSFLGTAITRCDTFGRTQPSPARIFDEAKQISFYVLIVLCLDVGEGLYWSVASIAKVRTLVH